MDPTFFARGLVVGFTIAAAVGPISLLTIRRTIAHGRLYGLVSGLGVALADASYGAVAAFGLTAVTASSSAPGRRSGSSAARSSSGSRSGRSGPARREAAAAPRTGRASPARSSRSTA